MSEEDHRVKLKEASEPYLETRISQRLFLQFYLEPNAPDINKVLKGMKEIFILTVDMNGG